MSALIRNLCTAATLALLAAPTLSHGAGCKLEVTELPVKMVGSRAVATVEINGTLVPLTVDSGAFYSMLTDAAAAQLGLRLRSSHGLQVNGLTGQIETHLTTVEKLRLLNGDLPGTEFIVGGNEPGAGTMGLLGRNLLTFTDVEYDLAHGVIRFAFPGDRCADTAMAYWAGDTPFTRVDLLRDARYKLPPMRARVKLNDHEMTALFDTGALTTVSVSAARRAGLKDADLTPAGTTHGAGVGTAKLWTGPFRSVDIGGEHISENRLEVADFEMEHDDMLIGIDFFLSHRIYVSKKQSAMYFTYNGGNVFAMNKGAAAPALLPFDAERAASAATVAATAATAATATTATVDQLMRRASASAARGDNVGALVDLDQACAMEATAACFAQRGAVHQALQNPVEALQDDDRALALDPMLADARTQRASLRFRAKDRDGTKADLDALDASLAPQSNLRLPMATLYLALDQPAAALVQLEDWLPAHPHDIRRAVALDGRCQARLELGAQLDQALDDCNDAVDSDDHNASYLDTRGWLLLRLGKDKKAAADFDRCIALRPRFARAHYGRGLARLRLNDVAGGEADMAAARALQPDIDQRVARARWATTPAAAQATTPP